MRRSTKRHRPFRFLLAASLARRALRATRWTALSVLVLAAGTAGATGVHPRIIGGTEAAPGEFPWQVALISQASLDLDRNVYQSQYCGGVLIDAEWVLTAAHCAVDEFGDPLAPADVRILAGEVDLAPETATVDKLIAVTQVHVHASYSADSLDNDIALLQLATPADCPGTCGPIELVDPANEPELVVGGSTAGTVTGWGDTDPSDVFSYPYLLHQVDLTVIGTDYCRDLYQGDPADITVRMFCAYGTAKDSCFGDSGGPLVVPKTDGTGSILAGLVSWGFSGSLCAVSMEPGVYTRIACFNDWIANTTGGAVTPATGTCTAGIEPNTPLPVEGEEGLPDLLNGGGGGGGGAPAVWLLGGLGVALWRRRISVRTEG